MSRRMPYIIEVELTDGMVFKCDNLHIHRATGTLYLFSDSSPVHQLAWDIVKEIRLRQGVSNLTEGPACGTGRGMAKGAGRDG